jgi:type II secretory pathway pseudopilin PulG
MNKKLIIAVIILIIILVASVGFWKWKSVRNAEVLRENQAKQEQQIQSQQQAAEEKTNQDNNQQNIDMSDWKTFRSEEYGFEVRYPKDWELIVKSSDPNKPKKEDSFVFQKERHVYFAVYTNGGFGYGVLKPEKNTREEFMGREAEMSWYGNLFPNFIHIISGTPDGWSNEENMIELRAENADKEVLDIMYDIYKSFQFI